jgi:hypothetical protein
MTYQVVPERPGMEVVSPVYRLFQRDVNENALEVRTFSRRFNPAVSKYYVATTSSDNLRKGRDYFSVRPRELHARELTLEERQYDLLVLTVKTGSS